MFSFFIEIFILVLVIKNLSNSKAVCNAHSLTEFNHFVKTAGDKFDISTGGRLTERQIGYLSEQGYRSILSVVKFDNNDSVYNSINGSFPSSDYEIIVAKSYGIEAKYIISNLTVEDVSIISKMINNMEKPLYIHCHVGWTATLFLSLHLYLINIINNSDDIYKYGLQYGWDYQATSNSVDLINSVTSSSSLVENPKIESTLTNGEASYKYYYWVHRLGNSDYYYNMGQLLESHLSSIVSQGYKVIISFRENGEPTTRLANETINKGPIDNKEFSDLNGNYDVNYEKLAVESVGMTFIHLPVPINSKMWSKKLFNQFIITFEQLGTQPVLIHCSTGFRSSGYMIAYIASKNNYCSDWALQQLSIVGFYYNKVQNKDIVDFLFGILSC